MNAPAPRPSPPRLVVVTDRVAAAAAGNTVREVVRAALEGGAPAILLRDKSRPDGDRRELGEAIAPLVRAAGAQLWVTADHWLADELDADGLHLPGDVDRPSAWTGPISRSVHRPAELHRARREGAAHAYVSPVASTTSKPGYGPALGASGVRRLVDDAAGLPLLALGGVTPENLTAWRAAGAAGVAVMGRVMGATDAADAVRSLLTAWQDAKRSGADEDVPTPEAIPNSTDQPSEHR